jgi:hypothetical protein
VHARDHQQVARRDRADVQEREHVIVRVHLARGQPAGRDLAERAAPGPHLGSHDRIIAARAKDA